MRLSRTTLVAAMLLTTAACGGDPAASRPEAPEPAGSTEPTSLDWQPTGHSPEDRVVVGEQWTAIADETTVTFEGPNGKYTLPEVPSGTVDTVLLDGESAVVSYGFGGETTTGEAYRVDLAERETVEIVSPEPANGGAWAMYDDSLYYPTLGEDDTYCLATLAVSDGNGEDGWCAPPVTGFSSVTASEHGVALMTFDNARPVSCRTLHLLDGTGTPTPVEGPTECKGWDVAATSTGVAWSEVPKPRRQEQAGFHAISDGTAHDLGRGTTGTLTPCGGDTFFVRDPQGPNDPARLMRWDGATLSVAFESTSRGNAFLTEPECADDVLTITALGEAGDEQVWAPVTG